MLLLPLLSTADYHTHDEPARHADEDLLDTTQHPRDKLRRAVESVQQGRAVPEAVAVIREEAHAHPHSVLKQMLYGQALMASGDYNQAARVLRRAYHLSPSHHGVAFMAAQAIEKSDEGHLPHVKLEVAQMRQEHEDREQEMRDEL